MDTQIKPNRFGDALKTYRTMRRMSQLELALSCNVSARHISFLETCRAQPSRDMVVLLADGLLLPRGVQNSLLQSAGYAPIFPHSDLTSDLLAPFAAILKEMMERHAPYPAMLCDRHWNIKDANPTARALIAGLGGDPDDTNAIRLMTDSQLAKQMIVNLPEVIHEMSARIQLEALEAGVDPVFTDMLKALDKAKIEYPYAMGQTRQPVLPLLVQTPLGRLSFITTIAHFGTSEDVTIRDLRLELLFPADDETRSAMRTLANT